MSERITEENFDRIAGAIIWNADGLLPAVVQDVDSRQVLMMAYMNREALRQTLLNGRTYFYSRSRRKLWLKGETSGHVQDVVDIRLDCDGDALLVQVRQHGVACHTEHYSCFYRALRPLEAAEEPATAAADNRLEWTLLGEPGQRPEIKDLGEVLYGLADVIAQRKREKPAGKYTTYLFEKGLDKILKKVGEEAAEVIIAAKNQASDEIIYEASDLLYHLLVLFEERGVTLADIRNELLSRHK